LLVVALLAFCCVAVLRLLGVDGDQYTVPVLALTPYFGAAALLLAVLCFVLRRRISGGIATLVALSLAAVVLPRGFAEDQPQARGETVRVMAANLNKGQADARTIMDAVRAHRVDVLTLPELTRPAVAALDEAGLAAELPYRAFDPGIGGDGSGIASRYPLGQVVIGGEGSTLSQPTAVVDLPGRDDVQIVGVHVQSASHGSADVWRKELADLPAPGDQVRVLAGDFNSTVDHAAFRALLDRGFADAAEQTGHGFRATWSSPPMTIDHVLVDRRCAVPDYRVVDLPGSDHDAVLAEITLP
jgi:endonuclease/exonuclease/phosphatase family metal-dependent hydrolase